MLTAATCKQESPLAECSCRSGAKTKCKHRPPRKIFPFFHPIPIDNWKKWCNLTRNLRANSSHTRHMRTRGCVQSYPRPTTSDWWLQEGALGHRKSSLGQTSSTHRGMSTICMHSRITPPPNTGTQSYTHLDMWYASFHAVYYIMSFL